MSTELIISGLQSFEYELQAKWELLSRPEIL